MRVLYTAVLSKHDCVLDGRLHVCHHSVSAIVGRCFRRHLGCFGSGHVAEERDRRGRRDEEFAGIPRRRSIVMVGYSTATESSRMHREAKLLFGLFLIEFAS